MTKSLESVMIAAAANAIRDAFSQHRYEFAAITLRAQSRFESRDWAGMQQDALERLGTYSSKITQTVRQIRSLLPHDIGDSEIWARIKARYADNIAGLADAELAETFFNSVTRKLFTITGVDPHIEFTQSARRDTYQSISEKGRVRLTSNMGLDDLVRQLVSYGQFDAPFRSLDTDVAAAVRRIESHWMDMAGSAPIDFVDLIPTVFYRQQGAYLVARAGAVTHAGARECTMPVVIALRHPPEGIVMDAVLMAEGDVSILFSFTRSYFHVATVQPHDIVSFLHSIIPAKRIAEIYTTLGHNKHGKTVLYRTLTQHLRDTTDRFEFAPGDSGLVMIVFALPSMDVVFKVIRDTFKPPKSTTNREVRERYDFVFRHDRAGRLVDAQEFEHLSFDRKRFTDDLLEELLQSASRNVTIERDRVNIRHLYTERRLTPLNLYMRNEDPPRARAAALDYGQSIKELAATNIFPGDLLPKNFGVTRHGRVVFYDYDELRTLASCNFRELPEARDDEDEMRSEPWFYVGPDDIFPEEFLPFLGLPDTVRNVFLEVHGDLLSPDFWQQMQNRHANGEIIEILPYPPDRRLLLGDHRS